MRRNLFWLSDDQWQQIEPFLPTDARGKDRVDDRRVIRAIIGNGRLMRHIPAGATFVRISYA